MKQMIAVAIGILLLAGITSSDPASGSDEPRVADGVGTGVTIDQLPETIAQLILAEVQGDATQTILRVAADDGGRYEITWTTAGATIRTSYSSKGTVLWREVKLSGEATEDQDQEEDADSEEEEEDFEREITIDLVPEPAKSTILKEAAGHELQDVGMVVVGGQLLYDADWHVDGYEIGIGVTPDGEVVEREREEIKGDGTSDD